jgi:hypothetical protein
VTEFRALLLVFTGALLLEAACLLGLSALGAGQLGVALGVIVPPAFAAQGIALVVRHYGQSRNRNR